MNPTSHTGHIQHCFRETRHAAVAWLLLVCLPATLWGQQPTQPQTPAPRDQQKGAADRANTNLAGKSTKRSDGTSNDRLFFVLPNFLTLENAPNVPPLTVGQKFKTTARNSFDPAEFVWYAALAGISQWRNTDSTFGQGADGYGKRYAVRFADGTIQNFFARAIVPSILRQDPRYYQMGHGGFFHRTGYALSRVIITRSDSGTTQFNYSEVIGSGAAASISTYTYHPRENQNVSKVMNIWASQMAFDALSFTIKEFWPDIRRKIHPSKSSPATTNTAPATGKK